MWDEKIKFGFFCDCKLYGLGKKKKSKYVQQRFLWLKHRILIKKGGKEFHFGLGNLTVVYADT